MTTPSLRERIECDPCRHTDLEIASGVHRYTTEDLIFKCYYDADIRVHVDKIPVKQLEALITEQRKAAQLELLGRLWTHWVSRGGSGNNPIDWFGMKAFIAAERQQLSKEKDVQLQRPK